MDTMDTMEDRTVNDEQERLRRYSFENLCIYMFNRLGFIISHLEELEKQEGMQGYHLNTAKNLTRDTIDHAKEVIDSYEPWKPKEPVE